jgi:uncharacterized membrane protein (DUF106 family)
MKVLFGIVVGYVGVMAATNHIRNEKIRRLNKAADRYNNAQSAVQSAREVRNG